MPGPELLVTGMNCFPSNLLFDLVAELKGLRIANHGSTDAHSEPVKVYVLDQTLVAVLAKRGISQTVRSNVDHEIVTFVDENPQEPNPGKIPNNYWYFRRRGNSDFNMELALCVSFKLKEELGVLLSPNTRAPFISPKDKLPNYRMFQALTENDADAPVVAKELVASPAGLFVSWSEIDLGGLRSLASLFQEFAGDNEAVAHLASDHRVFDPCPYQDKRWNRQDVFVTEPAQMALVELWRGQLAAYRQSLAL